MLTRRQYEKIYHEVLEAVTPPHKKMSEDEILAIRSKVAILRNHAVNIASNEMYYVEAQANEKL